MLERMIELSGGQANISRILKSGDELILEVISTGLVSEELTDQLDDSLSQIRFTPQTETADEVLFSTGRRIADRQLTQVSRLTPSGDTLFRPGWHISPPTGLLNDPNGFICHKGTFHLFYQWYPFGCVHKDKYWAHLTSKDLINWSSQPVALTPSDWFDSHGVFSGHALSHDDKLMLFYTGNVRIGEQRDRLTTQCLAVSEDGIQFDKLGPVVPELPPGVTPHCRDPKVIRVGENWWMLLGVQRSDLKGRLALYKSSDLTHWEFDGLYGEELGDFGYMWECPDLFQLDGQWLAVIGPQGISSESRHHTIEHHNGYLNASVSEENGLVLSEFRNLDHGFDFYAPQTTETEDGRRILTAWMGLPDEVNHPSADEGWIHQLTAIRELSLSGGNLVQKPARELASLRCERQTVHLSDSHFDPRTKSFELQTVLKWGSVLTLFGDDKNGVTLTLDSATRSLLFNRSQTLIREGDTVRERKLDSETVHLQILADSSSLEIFVNHGEFVMSGRIFTPQEATEIRLDGEAELVVWPLKQAKI